MKKGFTLVEMLFVVVIFSFLFGALLVVMTSSDKSWRTGRDKITEQQEARKAIDNMSWRLRQSNPNWLINGISYPVTITANNRIDFYQPVFDAQGNITTLQKVTFKLNPSDTTQLLKKVGTQNDSVIATEVQSINFSGGCAGCSTFTCPALAADCPVVKIDIQTLEDKGFSLSSKVTLRNTNITLSDDTEVQQPEAGEF